MNLLSIDLNTIRLSNQSYLNLLSSVNCEQTEIHIYNYIEQKHNKLDFCHGEILHKYQGSRKKIALDIKQALDIIEQCTKTNFDNVYIMCGEYESEFLFKKLDEINVAYHKISLTSIRQMEVANSDFEIIEQSTAQSNEQVIILNKEKTGTQSNKQIATQINEQNESQSTEQTAILNSEQTVTQCDKKSNIIPFEIDEGNKEQTTDGKTKLSPEQIKKIYNYIKYKQMQKKLKSM